MKREFLTRTRSGLLEATCKKAREYSLETPDLRIFVVERPSDEEMHKQGYRDEEMPGPYMVKTSFTLRRGDRIEQVFVGGTVVP